MTFFEFVFKKSNNIKTKNINNISKTLELKNKNIVYPKNTEQDEVNALYDEIRNNGQKKNNVNTKYANNVIKNNKEIQKHAKFISEKEKYKEMENNFNKLMQKGNNIFVKYDE